MLNMFKMFAENLKDDNFVSHCKSRFVIKRGKQTFAVFGDVAYDVSTVKFKQANPDAPVGSGKICVPINGRYIKMSPAEGSGGILGMYISPVRGKLQIIGPTFVACGWLYEQELGMPVKKIWERIADDVKNGKNVFTLPLDG